MTGPEQCKQQEENAPASVFDVVEQPWQWYEDLPIETSFECGGFVFSVAEVKAFARRYDPQGFHIDETVAAKSVVGTLFASSIHTLAASVGIFVRATRSLEIAVGLELRRADLPRPALPDVPYRVFGRWSSMRLSASHPRLGIARWEAETRNGAGDVVLGFGSTLMVRRRVQEPEG